MVKCSNFITNAIEFCISSSGKYSTREEILTCLQTHNSMIHSKFRYSIAQDIARFLLLFYKLQIKGINLYGSTMEYTAGKYSDIDIIIRVSTLDHGLIEVLKEIDVQLCKEYSTLLSVNCDDLHYFIDIHIINDDPNQKRHPSKAYLEHILVNDSIALC